MGTACSPLREPLIISLSQVVHPRTVGKRTRRGRHSVGIIIDGGPKVISFVVANHRAGVLVLDESLSDGVHNKFFLKVLNRSSCDSSIGQIGCYREPF